MVVIESLQGMQKESWNKVNELIKGIDPKRVSILSNQCNEFLLSDMRPKGCMICPIPKSKVDLKKIEQNIIHFSSKGVKTFIFHLLDYREGNKLAGLQRSLKETHNIEVEVILLQELREGESFSSKKQLDLTIHQIC